MKELTVGKNDAGQRVDRYLAKTLPLLPASLCQKYLRLKRIKRNGKRCEAGDKLAEGDVLGCVLFVSPRGSLPATEVEYKLAQTVAMFLGKQMES